MGKTVRHLNTRIDEHFNKDTAITTHLEGNPMCKRLCNENCFSILDYGQTDFQLSVKETLHINLKMSPDLNRTVSSYKLSLLL